jgi:uncharacterized protein DUF1206
VVISIIGIFLIVAASQHNASKARGMDGALQELAHQHQPFGQVLLGVVALAAQQAGRPDLIRSPKHVLAHTWEGLATS